jgi:hypothetical protein
VREGGGFLLTELLSDAMVDDIRAKTGAPFEVVLKS